MEPYTKLVLVRGPGNDLVLVPLALEVLHSVKQYTVLGLPGANGVVKL